MKTVVVSKRRGNVFDSRGVARPYGTDTMSEMGIVPMCDEPERQPVNEPTEAQIEAAAKYLCQKFVYRNDGYTFDSAWELFAYNFRRDGQDLLRAVLAAKEQPK